MLPILIYTQILHLICHDHLQWFKNSHEFQHSVPKIFFLFREFFLEKFFFLFILRKFYEKE